MEFIHLVKGLLHGVQPLQELGESTQEFEVQLLPQQEQFLVVLLPSDAEVVLLSHKALIWLCISLVHCFFGEALWNFLNFCPCS